MKKPIETLDEYLDQLDQIKERVAESTKAMNARQVVEYFAGAQRRLEKATGRKLHLRKAGKKATRSHSQREKV